jgi:hypothetical protein
MRIELPAPTWADAQRAQDDAHTLTLPAQRALTLAETLLPRVAEDGATARVDARAPSPATLTLTF